MLAFRLASQLMLHRGMSSLPRRSDIQYRGVLCTGITLAYRLYSF